MASVDNLGGIAAFVTAVESGGFSAAAERLHLSRSTVGKTVARLEARLGVRLFHRTTRSLNLTDEGQAYYERCVRVMRELELAEDELQQGRRAPVGRLRISVPVLFGRLCVAPVLLDVAAAHPQLQLEIGFSDRRVELIEEGIDLAIRVGPLADTAGLKMRPLGEMHMLVCATPSYLAAHGTPQTAEALAEHNAILYGRLGRNVSWQFIDEAGQQVMVRPRARLALDDLEAMAAAVRAGLGISRLPRWLVAEQLASGELVAVLPGLHTVGFPVHAVWPYTRQYSARLRVVLDALAQALPPLLA